MEHVQGILELAFRIPHSVFRTPWPAVVPFINPGLLGATALAAAIPVIIHLINRRRYRRVRWAAMGFLLAASDRSLRRLRFEHWTLLLVRTAVVVLLGLAIARPFLSDTAFIGLGRANWHRVLLIDNSLSASVVADSQAGGAMSPPPAAAAARLLETFPTGDAVSVITLAAPVEAVIGHAAFDRRTVRERIAAIRATQRSTDLAGGLAAAARVLEDSPTAPGNRAVYIVSDQTASAWRGQEQTARAAGRMAADARLVLVATATDQRDNLAVTAFACAESLPGTHGPVRLTATVSNFGQKAAHGATLQVRLEGRIVRRLLLDALEPGGRREVAFSIAPGTAGTHPVEVRLEPSAGDLLPADDGRHLSVEVFESVPVLLVDGRPGTSKFAGETGYLATAMAPGAQPGQTTLLAPRRITELELPGEVLGAYRLIVLCNVQRLTDEMWHRLEAFVEAGGGLMIFLGDAVSTDNYNRLGYAEGEGLLPARLAQPVGDPSDRDRFLRLQREAFTHPAMSDFAEADKSGLFLKGRVYRLVPVEADPAVTTVLLRYDNDLPAVLERSWGTGRVCLVTTTANMAWNNLAARGDYVSWIWSLSSYLAGGTGGSRNLLAGEEIVEPLGAAEVSQPLRVTGPDGLVHDAGVDVSGGRCHLRSGPVEQAGAYTVTVGRRKVHFAANVDPVESDLQTMDEPALRELLRCPFAHVADLDRAGRAVGGGGSEELSHLLQYLVLLLLVYESWLAMRFASRRF